MKQLKNLKAFMIFVALFATITACNKEEDPEPEPQPTPAPVASFTVTNDNCNGPCTITFTNTSTNATSYNWNFGDGSAASTTASPSHLYNTPGSYTVTLTATGAGGTNTTTRTVTIVNPYYLKMKVNGTQFNATVLTATRGTSSNPRTLTISGASAGNSNPKFTLFMEETFIGFVDGIQGTFSSSTYPVQYMTYTDASGVEYSTRYDSNGVYIFFSEITYTNGGEVAAAQTSFSGSMSTSTGSAINITEGNFRMTFSN